MSVGVYDERWYEFYGPGGQDGEPEDHPQEPAADDDVDEDPKPEGR